MIRRFSINDTKQVMQIWLEGNIDAHSFIPKEYWETNYLSVQTELLKATVFVYEEHNGKVLGFAGMTGNYLAGIFVDKSVRCMGIGKSLLSYIKAIYPSFYLHVYKKNDRAVKFYCKEGLTKTSESLDEQTKEPEYTFTWRKNS